MTLSAAPCAPSNLRRIEEGSFESSGSSEASIYNAVRVASPVDDSTQKFDTSRELNSIVLDRATIARLLLISSAHSLSCVSLQGPRYCAAYPTRSSRWHPYIRPDRTAFSTYTGRRLHLSPPARSVILHPDRRKVLSLNDADSRPQGSQWTATLASPVSPVRPRYPPPVRAPTPPGLPSFGTREAMRYYPHLAHADPADDNPPQLVAENTPDTSYGAALRRFLGLSASSPRQGGRTPIARAPDGTAVLGHFPHRHSGHGITTSRRLDDHPFHRRALPVAPTYRARPPSPRHTGVPRQNRRYYALADADDLPLVPLPFQSPAPIAASKHDMAPSDEPTPSWTASWGVCCCLQEQEEFVSGAQSSTCDTQASAQIGRLGHGTLDSAACGWSQNVGQLSLGIWMSLRRVATRVTA